MWELKKTWLNIKEIQLQNEEEVKEKLRNCREALENPEVGKYKSERNSFFLTSFILPFPSWSLLSTPHLSFWPLTVLLSLCCLSSPISVFFLFECNIVPQGESMEVEMETRSGRPSKARSNQRKKLSLKPGCSHHMPLAFTCKGLRGNFRQANVQAQCRLCKNPHPKLQARLPSPGTLTLHPSSVKYTTPSWRSAWVWTVRGCCQLAEGGATYVL